MVLLLQSGLKSEYQKIFKSNFLSFNNIKSIVNHSNDISLDGLALFENTSDAYKAEGYTFSVINSIGVKVRNMTMDFNTGGTWRHVRHNEH